MATDLLSDGIRRFAADTEKLEKMLMEKLWIVCCSNCCGVDRLSHRHSLITNKQNNVPFQ